MSGWTVLVLLASVVVAIHSQALAGNSYVEKQLLCALDKAPCDVLGRQIKDALPEIIGRNCQSCDSRQVANAKRIARFVQTKYPQVWNALVEKYSPKRP
ncbi:allergen Tha p 1 [Aethina tumida]|uniref:allergen Tha p 1 n=1 Tax=Aethina tumida TaxID=116153 RepID=UPI00096B031F|nr:allergen Tha p 1 [Aethina tumida]